MDKLRQSGSVEKLVAWTRHGGLWDVGLSRAGLDARVKSSPRRPWRKDYRGWCLRALSLILHQELKISAQKASGLAVKLWKRGVVVA